LTTEVNDFPTPAQYTAKPSPDPKAGPGDGPTHQNY
jgi:hypothetical protein